VRATRGARLTASIRIFGLCTRGTWGHVCTGEPALGDRRACGVRMAEMAACPSGREEQGEQQDVCVCACAYA
jgi:hypothetical protein